MKTVINKEGSTENKTTRSYKTLWGRAGWGSAIKLDGWSIKRKVTIVIFFY